MVLVTPGRASGLGEARDRGRTPHGGRKACTQPWGGDPDDDPRARSAGIDHSSPGGGPWVFGRPPAAAAVREPTDIHGDLPDAQATAEEL